MAKYFKTKNIPSIQLSRELIEKIIRTMETEYNRLIENQDKDDKDDVYYNSKRFSIRRKDKSIPETDVSQKFLDSDFDRDVEQIDLQISTKNRDLQVEINTSSWSNSNFSATSKDLDDVWVNGIMTKLAETFDTVKNLHQFWHSKKAYLVYFPVSIVIASLYAYLNLRYSTNVNIEILAIVWIITVLGWPFTFAMILQWVFPKVETKQSKRRKFKKIVISIVGVLILGIVANYLTDIIKWIRI